MLEVIIYKYYFTSVRTVGITIILHIYSINVWIMDHVKLVNLQLIIFYEVRVLTLISCFLLQCYVLFHRL